MSEKVCRYCAHWRQHEAQGSTGGCAELNNGHGSELAYLTASDPNDPLTPAVPSIVTRPDFGCSLWQHKHPDVEAFVDTLMSDPIRPDHYGPKGLQVLDALKVWMTPEENKGFYKANVIKYIARCGKKDASLQDALKAREYLDLLITELEQAQ